MKNQRMNRRTFIAIFPLGIIPFIIILAVSNIANGAHGSLQNALYATFTIILLIYAIYLFITYIIATLNRLHDAGWPWILVALFGLFTPLLVLLALVPGQAVNNKYGGVPEKKFDLRPAFIWW
jgi:uncharacterized membrane protein YhaH (DUF805 family)